MSEVLRVEGLTKQFPGVLAVDDLSFSLQEGEVLALLGENGAGKSTLTKIICGALKADRGIIYLGGKQVDFHNSHDAMEKGIAMVYQELSLAGGMSIAENIYMNRQPSGRFGFIDQARMYSDTQQYIDMFNIDATPSTQAKRLSTGEQQLVEISKAISLNPKVIIMDEPTSSLAENDIDILFDVIRKLKAENHAFIYISHKLSEVFRIADKVMVMRDGRHIGTKCVKEVDEQQLVNMMIGREIKNLYADSVSKPAIGEEYFTVDKLSATGYFKDISFSLKRGEILGLAGLVGAGRTEVASAIAGMIKIDSGSINLDDKKLNICRPIDAISSGIGYITEDRKKLGLFLDFTIIDNLIAPSLKEYSERGFMKQDKITAFANDASERFNIISTSTKQKVMKLSGGNQQKCLLAMWMSRKPEVIIFDEPTRGVDVGAKSEIYEKIRGYVSTGCGAIVISSEMNELLGLCDRILVMYHGKLRGQIQRDEFSEELVLSYASGLKCNIPQ
jgi:ABC-type sugar transport system ATPase subunit